MALAAVMSLAQAPLKDPLARARASYNASQYDQAIEAATEARLVPKFANAATLVLARAKLERFRVAQAKGEQAPADLASARDLLKTVDTTALTPRDQVDYFTGVGVSLYLEDVASGQALYGAAAELFDLALAKSDETGLEDREPLLEWWAGSLDRHAQLAPDSERRKIYARILQRAERELTRHDSSAAAIYWIAAASRGTDDIERAWSAAVAGWIRAGRLGPAGARLREDLDRLMTHAIIPERARVSAQGGDAQGAEAAMKVQWDELKAKWEK